MSYKEALKRFKQSYELTKDYDNKHWECRERIEHQEWVEQLSAAIEALEKQIPKKPIHKHKNYYCPICKEDGWVLWDDAEPNDFDNFCGKCGQALDWSD